MRALQYVFISRGGSGSVRGLKGQKGYPLPFPGQFLGETGEDVEDDVSNDDGEVNANVQRDQNHAVADACPNGESRIY